ncbi:uncharacterized protein LOC111891562 isoform X2 [Lactuca sativa]|uniref:uncharacterized protein LOC111891562 isoform X2 n=1 Tax=Lactuca sativa TaxID=4236 RepID=UPI000CD7E339|nr:uncharacterized protein LOC111891562 isoform X2 [Lactuca sativa]
MNICTRIFTATEESFSGDIRDWSLSKERIIKPYRKRGRKTNKIVRSMEISESSSTSRKRQRGEVEAIPEPQGSNQSLSLDNLIFSDTMVALRMMRGQFPHIDKVTVEPFILRSQLYSSVKDRTQVDRELESLKREKVLRIFKLNTGQDDHAVMFMEDYLNQMKRAVKSMEAKKQSVLPVFEWFEVHVIHSKPEPCIGHQELCSLLSIGGKVKDEDISLLINAGLLTRQLIDPDMYWFAIPNIGSLLKALTQGRKEVMSLLNRKKYKEMMLSLVEKKRLRFSPLDIRFHLRDLLGSGHLKTLHTPGGIVIRVVKD